jgi:hypothetical protein
MCMSQFGKMLCSTRIPKQGRDEIVNPTDSDYIVVIAKNQFYKLGVYEKNGKLKSESTLTANIKSIYEDSQKRKRAPLGILTCNF